MASSMVSASNLTNIAPNIDYAMEYFLPLPKGPVNEKFNSIYKEWALAAPFIPNTQQDYADSLHFVCTEVQ